MSNLKRQKEIDFKQNMICRSRCVKLSRDGVCYVKTVRIEYCPKYYFLS